MLRTGDRRGNRTWVRTQYKEGVYGNVMVKLTSILALKSRKLHFQEMQFVGRGSVVCREGIRS